MEPAMSNDDNEGLQKALRARILNVLPAASYQMDRFLKMVDVVVSNRSESACVETGPQPRLHLNSNFIEEYCQSDEHLLMLILHELYHIILGHTRLFPRLSKAHNIVFDAVINSILCHQFRDQDYIGFFQNLNSWSHFPERLLRPPPGWPDHPQLLPEDALDKEKDVINLLYGKKSHSVTYHDIFDLLKDQFNDEDLSCVLIGDHSGQSMEGNEDSSAINDELLKNILGKIAQDWPRDATKIGRGTGKGLADYLLPKPRSPRSEFLRRLKSLLDIAGVLRQDYRSPWAWQIKHYSINNFTPVPNWKDRQAFSKEYLFGQPPLLYSNGIQTKRALWRPKKTTHIYIDVSGSMNNDLPWLVGALAPLHKKGICRLYAFSTVVDEIKSGKLFQNIKNTFGTNIKCVYEHILNFPHKYTPTRVIVLTDGMTGAPSPKLHKEMKNRKVDLYVGLVGHASMELKPFAKQMVHLPDPDKSGN